MWELLIKCVAVSVSVLAVSWAFVRVFAHRQFFASPEDRDNTVVIFLVFGLIWWILHNYKDEITAEVIAGLAGALMGSISTMVIFYFKANGEKKQQPDESQE